MENRTTSRANHGSVPIASIIQRLTTGRQRLVFRLEALSEEDIGRVALHPRLRKAMRLLDWVYFFYRA